MRAINTLLIGICWFLISCSAQKRTQTKVEDGKLDVVFLQVNDVYEIAPLAGGKSGGVARIATLKKQYKKKNPNTYLIMAGDFLSPSVYNSLQYKGQRIRGRQMVESMNAAGFDFAIFGNHEFDLSERELIQRINESRFQWISSNAFHVRGDNIVPFRKDTTFLSDFPSAHILSLVDEDGTKAKIGLIGIVLPYNKPPYVTYSDPLITAKEIYAQLKDSCDAVIAITHQFMEDDRKLALALPGLTAIMGGHEHDMRMEKVGNVYITKADANAKTTFAIKLQIDKRNKLVTWKPELKQVNQKISIDSATNVVVQKWLALADEDYTSRGFNPREIIIKSGEALDGREAIIRSESTNLTRLITTAMSFAVPTADVVIINSGAIRVDDILYPPITQYDILRTLPFDGGITEVDMKGSLLIKVLEVGTRKNKGIGGFLQFSPVSYDESQKSWVIKGLPIDPKKTYHVAMGDYLITGLESNLDFLNEKNPEIVKVYPAITSTSDPRSFVRLAIVNYLKKNSASK